MRKVYLLLALILVGALPGHVCAKEISVSGEEPVKVLVHDHGLEAFQMFMQCIDSANSYVELCPCMTGGNLLKEMLTRLDKRMHQAPLLKTYLIIQPTFIDSEDRRILAEMKESWPERFFYVYTGCPSSTNVLKPNVMEMHVKLSLVDGKYFILGGSNFEDFMCTPGDVDPEDTDSPRIIVSGIRRPLAFRDQDVTLCSVSLGKMLREEFHKYFRMWEYYAEHFWFQENLEEFSGKVPEMPEEVLEATCLAFDEHPDVVSVKPSQVRVIFGGPHEGQPNAITQEFVRLIRSARSSLHIAQMYFVPKKEIIQGLIHAVGKQGVRLEVITNGCHELSPSMTEAYAWGNRMNYFAVSFGEHTSLWKKSFWQGKKPNALASFYEFAIRETQLHKKCMIVDGATFAIGSYNFGMKSDEFDYESLVVIESEEVAKKALKVFEKDRTLSRKVSEAEIFSWYFHPLHHVIGHLQLNFMPF
ncbi:phospholipase D-like domain-containing protein [Chlamydia pecorum]|uniref:Phospholipase D type proteinase n=1 Tax=Chlamydia pecorum (strain ATCC VR-628 / DSM 29919 / E58) TaxID=331635 RepID=A0AA34RDB8_CHLPE|nr:phosphatidylserine/phosphatidylglycerophosphate/cardiolipin synthase family protein [Chlamydia pecorum]AEB41649.1 phospholipase D type proteinase [Chlamydia pecorum E58]AGW39692.1 phospholipase D family protein [Chlamydia pecorum P787]ETF37416.1 phospholipase D type proteinase [Chlamydia pecorum VR629]ETF37922.1 phospholipase D type proteinase [Chlamydia pecorum DBDeUG]ETF38189.1 phospholipase D type proteinase [Chlamydia pecorum MC/MarsBar]